jgi:hypothetical protein
MFPSIAPLRNRWSRHVSNSRTGRPAPARKHRQLRLELETLEDRTVPTIVFTPQWGGDVISPGSTNDGMQHPTVNYIFSGSYWSTAQGQQDELALLNSAKSIMSGPYLSGLTQYGSDGKANFGTSWNDAATVPSNPSISALHSFLQNSITNHNAAPGSNDWQHAPIYVVVSDPNSSAGNYGGYNAGGTYLQSILWFTIPENMHMIWAGTALQNGKVWKDQYIVTLSHELAETMSDPDSKGITINPPNGPQIADGEAEAGTYGYVYRLSGEMVQAYWSRQDNAFIVPDGNSQKFYLAPIWSGKSFTGTYNLSIDGDQLGVNFADNIAIGGTSSNVSVSQNNQAANFDPGVIKQVNVDTRGGANFVRVSSVPVGVTVNIDSTGASNDTIVVGSGTHSLVGIQGTVNVSNTSGQTKLVVDALNDGARNVAITDHSVAFSGLTTVNYKGGNLWANGTMHGVTELDVIDGNGKNSVDILSVPSLTSVILDADTQDVIFGPAMGKVKVFRNHT